MGDEEDGEDEEDEVQKWIKNAVNYDALYDSIGHGDGEVEEEEKEEDEDKEGGEGGEDGEEDGEKPRKRWEQTTFDYDAIYGGDEDGEEEKGEDEEKGDEEEVKVKKWEQVAIN